MVIKVRGSCDPLPCDPLPDGNGQSGSAERAGSLGGVVDDYLQVYTTASPPDTAKSKSEVVQKYGQIEEWDVSRVKNMMNLFFGYKGNNKCSGNFNNDISKWNVRRVTNMKRTLMGTCSFNIDLSSWELAK